jgi:hypothetical protein
MLKVHTLVSRVDSATAFDGLTFGAEGTVCRIAIIESNVKESKIPTGYNIRHEKKHPKQTDHNISTTDGYQPLNTALIKYHY